MIFAARALPTPLRAASVSISRRPVPRTRFARSRERIGASRWLSAGSGGEASSPPAPKAPPAIKKYVGPFSGVTLRLKRVSVFTALTGCVGMPALLFLHTGTVPAAGQAAVSGTALCAAVGSTVLLNYCVSPYVHSILQVGEGDGATYEAVTANLMGMRVTTSFDLAAVQPPTGTRPFCNFVAAGVPMYVHPELVNDKAFVRKLIEGAYEGGEGGEK